LTIGQDPADSSYGTLDINQATKLKRAKTDWQRIEKAVTFGTLDINQATKIETTERELATDRKSSFTFNTCISLAKAGFALAFA